MRLNDMGGTYLAKDDKTAVRGCNSIYDVAPEFSHCCEIQGKMYFVKEEAVKEAEDLGIKVFRRKNHEVRS